MDDEELNEQEESGMQDQVQQVQNAANQVSQKAQRAKARAQAAARLPGQMLKATGQALETTGKVLEIAGKGIQFLGKITQAAGKGLQQAGQGIYNGGKALFDAGEAACSTGVGAIGGVPMMIAGILGMGIGKATELLGKAIEFAGKVIEKIGKAIEKAGKALAEMGKHLKALGDKAIQAANAATGAAKGGGSNLAGGGSDGGSDSDSGSGTGKIPSLTKGKGGLLKIILIPVIVIVVLVVLILSIKESTVDDGTYEEGNNKNVPYVVSSAVMDELVIVNDNSGNYTYAFKNSEGEIVSLDVAIDNAIDILVSNGSTSLSNLGSTRESQKALIKQMIQAEIATQYPNITLNEDLGYDASTTTTINGSGNDYCVDMESSTALPECTEEQLIEMINNSNASQKGKDNMLSVVSDLVSFQSKYKVNAVFFMSVVKAESGWGTGWDLIDESTYNWVSIKGTANGGYVDRNGTSWNKYNSYSDATEAWFRLISNPSGSYFGSQKYTVYQIGPTYCNTEWSSTVSGYIEGFYASIGMTPTTADTSTGTVSTVGAGNTGAVKITEEINQDENIQGGITIQRKDENGNVIDLKYTSTQNFNALVAANSAEALNYYTLVKTSGTTTTSSGGVVLEGNDVAEQVWNFLINDMGYNEYVAAGVMGNIANESSFNPSADNGTHYGLCQWSKTYCPEVNGKDLAGQLEFFRTWINSGEFDTYAKNYQAGFSYVKFLQLQDAGQAAIAFATVMERFGSPYSGGGAGDSEYAQRAQDAQNYYATYGGNSTNSTTNSSTNTTTTTTTTNTNEVTSLDNFLFIGDSRYEGIETQLQSLGANITAKGVGSSVPKNWIQPVRDGGGIVYRGFTTTSYKDIGTLPTTVSGVSVMLGVNNVNGSTQVSDMETLLEELHKKYPDVPIFVNSVYYLGTAYGNATDSMNQGVDTFNQAMKDFCNKNDWAYYIDISENLYNDSGYLKVEYSTDGLHINSTEGIDTLVNNIKNGILNESTTSENEETSTSSRAAYALVVASQRDVNTVVVNSYEYSNTYRTDIGHGGIYDSSLRFSDTPAAETVSNTTTTTYYSRSVDYQTALQNYTLYFDFLWAVLADSGSTDLVSDWASLAYDNQNVASTVVITTYSDVSTSTSTTSQSNGYITRTTGNVNGVVITDHYNVTETTTITTTTSTAKPCITYADTWLIKYENNASSYEEYNSETQKVLTEKTDENSTDPNIIKLLKSNQSMLETLTREQYIVEEMLADNEKVSFMIDIYDYILDIANGEVEVQSGDLSNLMGVGSFELGTFKTSGGSTTLGEFNGNFLEIAQQCHAYVRQNGFTYVNGNSIPITENSPKGIDCSAYVSWALYEYGYTDLGGGQLSCSGGTIVPWCNNNLDLVWQGCTHSVSSITNIQPGDICIMGYDSQQGGTVTKHTQIFAGYDADGTAIWYNCGSTNSIRKEEGIEKYNSTSQAILYVYRVPNK